MVIDSEGPRTGHDRGQLLLISALAIAFILLGVIVVFNSVQYTQTVDSGSAGESMADVPMTEQQLEDGIEGLVKQYNATELNDPPNEVEEDIEEFVEQYANARAHQRPVSVDITDGPTVEDSLSIENGEVEGTVKVSFTYEYRTSNVAKNGQIYVEVDAGDML